MKKDLKVALVAPYFPPVVGGIETYVYELSKRLSERDIVVYVFTSGNGTAETSDGVEVFRLRALDVKDLPLPLKIPYPIPFSLISKLAEVDADVIHVHGHIFFTSLEGAIASRIARKPLVLTVHDIGVAYQDSLLVRAMRPFVDSILSGQVFKSADLVIAQNNVTCAYASKFSPRKMIVMPPGIDRSKFKPSEDSEGEHVTFIAARLVPQKGCETFIRSIPAVLEEVGDAEFMIIGDGFQRSRYEKWVKDWGIQDHVSFVGRISHDDVPMFLAKSKIVVFPSEIPTGLVLLEAAAMKKPIITTRNAWAQDSLGETPLYIPPNSPGETARAIVRLLREPDERRRIAEQAYRKVASDGDWDTVVSGHIELYEELARTGSKEKRGIT